MSLPLFGYPTRLLDIHFGHKAVAFWNVGVTVFDITPDGSGLVSTKSSSGLPPPPLSSQQIAAILKKFPPNTTILAQQTPASLTFHFQGLALPPVSSATATAEVVATPPDPHAIQNITSSSFAYLLAQQQKFTGSTGLTFQFLGGENGYTEPTEGFTIPLWVSVINKKFA